MWIWPFVIVKLMTDCRTLQCWLDKDAQDCSKSMMDVSGHQLMLLFFCFSNMSLVHYKFKSSLDYQHVKFDGLHISVGDLKKEIVNQKHLRLGDFELEIANAQTGSGETVLFNSNEYLERLTRTGPKHLHVLYKYILSKFSAFNMNAHTHTQTRAHTHTKIICIIIFFSVFYGDFYMQIFVSSSFTFWLLVTAQNS